MPARIVYLDIERQSGIADGIWDLKQRSWLSPSQILERPRTICFAWRWEGEDKTHFSAEWDRGHKAMIAKAHKVMDEADFICGWNSKFFDVKHLREEMLMHDMFPPSPHKDIDLMLICRRNFGFLSNRMAYIAEQLDLDGKMSTGGAGLWKQLRTSKGEDLKTARETMCDYNKRDVELTQELWHLLKPWANGVNLSAYEGGLAPSCPVCSSANVNYRGLQRTLSTTYRRFQCQDCGKWGRTNNGLSRTNLVPIQ